jgi:hypothetical protein
MEFEATASAALTVLCRVTMTTAPVVTAGHDTAREPTTFALDTLRADYRNGERGWVQLLGRSLPDGDESSSGDVNFVIDPVRLLTLAPWLEPVFMEMDNRARQAADEIYKQTVAAARATEIKAEGGLSDGV